MAQKRLSNLTIISMERDIVHYFKIDDIIKSFAEKKARKRII